ncbi:hypothetical protein OX284_007040 [Flavobacterium sp. SUN046]|uniref:hypothetical protein n=1 Tax=Flavobacterium sp. SUN046 TaxID=3002440 RepID=UPI002DBD5DA9|nr:hypothetical protein [Flavobacterium sp. SUN046]MEC4049180.1 hypothetical protein [Flavobacterium sp. SUN046]
MKNIIYTLTIIVLIIISACTKYDANGNSIKNYEELQKAKWLLGEWEKSDSLGILKETLTSKVDITFVGQSYYIQNKKDTLHDEQIELVQDGEHLIYKATVKGENNDAPIPFQMTKDEDSLLFLKIQSMIILKKFNTNY